ncbi:MAG: hypothetical protein R3293_06755, partial [Candidatus Promineifilaceae bacterium]|nr:hypothetical protein [Candidatus Promineifilaceae bacterium]
MNGRIGHLHTNYRLLGQSNPPPVDLRERLDRLAIAEVAPTVANALSHVFAGDETVYVLRQVTAPLWLNYHEGQTEKELAQEWGRQLRGRIVRSIAADPGDGRNLQCLDNKAHYIARFVIDLVNGRAWDAWYYGTFQSFRASSTGQTLHEVLMANKRQIAAVLGYLNQAGALEKLLGELEPHQIASFWQEGLGASPLYDAVTIRPLWQTACKLLSQLELWASGSHASENLWPVYLASQPLAADWREQKGLTTSVLDIIYFLRNRGQLRSTLPEEDTFEIRLDRAVSSLDWLDKTLLEQSLRNWFASEKKQQPTPHQIRQSPTPRQKALLRDLLALLPQQVMLDKQQLDNPANALRLYAALMSQESQWNGDPLATALIARILHYARLLAESGVLPDGLVHLRLGDMQAALDMAPEDGRMQTAVIFRHLLNLGPEALDIV